VALIDRSEARHGVTVEWFKAFKGTLFSTEAVLTEVLYLLNFSTTAQISVLDFVIKSIVEIVPADIDSMQKAKVLLSKYSDLPMDYADATIVCLAMDTGIRNVVTFDRKDFNIYCLPKNKVFTITNQQK
jgi:predicted nucleic acid-binding protein